MHNIACPRHLKHELEYNGNQNEIEVLSGSKLTSRIPSSKQINDTWVKSGFKDAKDDPKAEHVSPFVDEAKSLLCLAASYILRIGMAHNLINAPE